MNQPKTKILIVEDDKNMGFLLTENLKISNYDVVLCKDGIKGLNEFFNNSFDLCILDIMLPGRDGIDLATKIREKNKEIPIVFLTAKSLDDDKIEGFKAGCDDYVTKPFNVEELIWRIKALLKRTGCYTESNKTEIYKFGNYVFNYAERKLFINEQSKKLSAKEAGLLKILVENINNVVSRSAILIAIWGRDDYFVSKTLDVYLTKVRKLINEDQCIEILNIHGLGYKLIEKKE